MDAFDHVPTFLTFFLVQEVIEIEPEEIQESIIKTKSEIDQVKQELAMTTDPKEKRKLSVRLKELQFLQLWHLDQRERK